MPRLWVPGVGSTPYTVDSPVPTSPREDEFETIAPAVPVAAEETAPGTPTSAEKPYSAPIDPYLQGKLSEGYNIDPFGKVSFDNSVTFSLPTIATSQPDPAADTFWNNPGRLARYYNAIVTAPEGWQPPSWLDPKAVVTAYKQMEAANGYQDWTKWKAFSATDPRFSTVQQMGLPPADYLRPDELRYVAAAAASGTTQNVVVDYNSLPLWQQVLSYITPEQEGFENTPWLSKGSSATVSGLLTGLGAYGMGAAALGGLAALGVAASPALLAVPILLGVGMGGAAFYESIANEEIKVPVVKDALQFFDILSKWAEQGIGLTSQVLSEGAAPILSRGDQLQAAWKASEATYESSKVETINLFARTLDFLDFNSQFFEVDADNLAKPGESWAFNYGLARPIKNTYAEGAAGLQQLRSKLTTMYQAGATEDTIQQEIEAFKATFYSSGSSNDLVFGTVIDPANWVPFFSSKIGEAATRKVDPMLADSFRQSRGNLFIDSLPFGVQQVAMGLSNTVGLKLRDTTGPFSAIAEYKARRRYSVLPGTAPASSLSSRTKAFLNLTPEGKFAELQPRAAQTPRTGVLGRTMDFLDYVSSLTEDSKATTMLDMFHDNLSQTLLDPMLSRSQKLTILQKAAGIAPVDMANVSEQYIGSAAMVTIAEGNKYALQNGGMEVFQAFVDAERDFIPFVNRTAAAIGRTANELAKAVNDKAQLQTLSAQLLRSGMPEEDVKKTIRRLKEGLTGSNAIPLTEEEMWVKFSSTMYSKMVDYLHETYKLAPENNILRAAHIMKGAQNLMLLGFSPQYLYENVIGNKVAMASVGVLGFMRPDDIRSTIVEMGLDPARIGEGFTPSGDPTQSFDMAGSSAKDRLHEGKRRIHETKRGLKKKDLFAVAQRGVTGASKLGVMSALSSRVEASDSLQAFTSALTRFYDSEWRVGRGLRRAPLEQVWEQKYPGITEFVYSAIEGSKNIPQVQARLFESLGKPTATDVVRYAAEQTGMDPEILSQTFESTGITSAISKGLESASTAQDVDNVFASINDTLTQRVSDTFIREVRGLDAHTAAKVRTEGVSAILRATTLSEISKLQEMLASKREWEALYTAKPSMSQKEFGERARLQFAREAENWERVYQRELMMAKGVTDAFGMLSDKAAVYIQGLERVQQAWISFHRRRVELLEDFAKGSRKRSKETQTDYTARRAAEWAVVQSEISKGYDRVSALENSQSALNDEVFYEAYAAKTGWNNVKVKEWREAVRQKKAEIHQMQADFQASLVNATPAARAEAWKKFTPTLNAKINELDGIEHQYSAAIMRGVPLSPTTTPVIQTLVDAVQTQINTAKTRTGLPAASLQDTLGAQLAALGFEGADIASMTEAQMYATLQKGIPAHVVAMMDLAVDMGMKEEKGGIEPVKLLNIVKKHTGDANLTSLRDVGLDTFIQAMKEHRTRHKLQTVLPKVRASLYANELARMTDNITRRNAIKQLGYQTRAELREYWKKTMGVSDTEIEAAMVVIDARAKQWALERQYADLDAARDAFYATTFAAETTTRAKKKAVLSQTMDPKDIVSFANASDPVSVKFYSELADFVSQLDADMPKADAQLASLCELIAKDIETMGICVYMDVPFLKFLDTAAAVLNAHTNGAKDLFTRSMLLSTTETMAYTVSNGERTYCANMTGHVLYDSPAMRIIAAYGIGGEGIFICAGGKVYEYAKSAIRQVPSDYLHPAKIVMSPSGEFLGFDAFKVFVPSMPLIAHLRSLPKAAVTSTPLAEYKMADGSTLLIHPAGTTLTDYVMATSEGPRVIAYAFTPGTESWFILDRNLEDGWAYTPDDGMTHKSKKELLLQPAYELVDKEGRHSLVNIEDLVIPDYATTPAHMAHHSLSFTNLVATIRSFGGPLSPSVAVTRIQKDGRFGVYPARVSLVLRKEAITPERGKVDMHAGDSWTPMLNDFDTELYGVFASPDDSGAFEFLAYTAGLPMQLLHRYPLPPMFTRSKFLKWAELNTDQQYYKAVKKALEGKPFDLTASQTPTSSESKRAYEKYVTDTFLGLLGVDNPPSYFIYGISAKGLTSIGRQVKADYPSIAQAKSKWMEVVGENPYLFYTTMATIERYTTLNAHDKLNIFSTLLSLKSFTIESICETISSRYPMAEPVDRDFRQLILSLDYALRLHGVSLPAEKTEQLARDIVDRVARPKYKPMDIFNYQGGVSKEPRLLSLEEFGDTLFTESGHSLTGLVPGVERVAHLKSLEDVYAHTQHLDSKPKEWAREPDLPPGLHVPTSRSDRFDFMWQLHHLAADSVYTTRPHREVLEDFLTLFPMQGKQIDLLLPYFEELIQYSADFAEKYYETKVRGVLPPQDILYAAVYGSLDASAEGLEIKKWFEDNGIDYVETDLSYASFLSEAINRGALFQQGTRSTAKGETYFLDDGRAVIRGLNAPDLSTMVHELGHVFLQTLSYNELNAAVKVGGLKDIREYYRLQTSFRNLEHMQLADQNRYVAFEEWFARGWEVYLIEGKAPLPELQPLFTKFTHWLLGVYKRLRKIGGVVSGLSKYKAFRKDGETIDIHAQVNGRSLADIFDAMLAGREGGPDIPAYHDLLQSHLTIQKSIEPGAEYGDLLDKAQAKVYKMLMAVNLPEDQTLDQVLANGGLVELSDGTIVDADLAEQIKRYGRREESLDDLTQDKVTIATNATFAMGKAVPFKQLGELQDLPKEFGGPGLYDPSARIPAKGIFVVRIKGFETDGTHFGAAVYRNGVKVAFLPSTFAADVESTVNGKVVRVLGYDIDTQRGVVYQSGNKLYIMPPDAAIREGVEADGRLKQEADDMVPPVGTIPMDSLPGPEPLGSALHELRRDHLQPALSAMQNYARSNIGKQKMQWEGIDAETQQQINDWVTGDVSADMGQVKRVATKYGEMRRDRALINYNQRYGFDEILGLVWPYEMWYTRTMINWAKNMVDRPQWFGMYARLEEQRKQMEGVYIPNRLKGTARIAAPWMPEWAGGSMYTDPMRRLFPFANIASSLDMFDVQRGQVEYIVSDVLSEMVETGEITEDDRKAAIDSKQGPVYEKAMQQAQAQQEQDTNPMTMANMMLTPAMWWTTPSLLAQKRNSEIGTTPGYRAVNAIEAVGKDTALQPLTDVVGLLGKPESLLRENVLGMDKPTNLFGQYGNYYLNREISNMAAEGKITPADAMNAVVQKSGPIWDQAMERVIYQQTLKVPGIAPLQAIKAGASPIQVIGALVASAFPASLFPKGEQEMAKMRGQIGMAYAKAEAGDEEAISKFYADYPVYSLKSLIKEEDPVEQMRMTLTNHIWSKYHALGGANKRQVRRYLGADFDKFVADKEYRNLATVEQLAEWASGLGADIPTNAPSTNPPEIPYYDSATDQAYTEYQQWRNTTFPNWYQLQTEYYAQPEGPKRAAYLASHPELKRYFTENSAYKKKHPNIAALSKELNTEVWQEDVRNRMTTSMRNQLQNYAMGRKLGEGTTQSLRMLYKSTAADSGLSFEQWLDAIVTSLNP